LAKTLDQLALETRGVVIAPAMTPDSALPVRRGSDVAVELGGRLLVRYMLRRQLGSFAGGSVSKHYVTPTPLSSDGLGSFLALPSVTERREFVMLIDPKAVPEVLGPRWVLAGEGIEYLLPNGFPPHALALPWEIEVA
jgi:hypothetical protein